MEKNPLKVLTKYVPSFDYNMKEAYIFLYI